MSSRLIYTCDRVPNLRVRLADFLMYESNPCISPSDLLTSAVIPCAYPQERRERKILSAISSGAAPSAIPRRNCGTFWLFRSEPVLRDQVLRLITGTVTPVFILL